MGGLDRQYGEKYPSLKVLLLPTIADMSDSKRRTDEILDV